MPKLPAEFADLEQFADWALESERDRYAKRLAAGMSQMQTFYDAAFPRIEDAIAYCDKFEWPELPEDARALMHVMQSLITVTFPIEVWKQARVPDSGAAYVDLIKEPVV
jgi:hypothetical protein